MDVKEFTKNLVKQVFGDYVVSLEFTGPYEYEEILVDVLLKEKPADFEERMLQVFQRILDEDLDVLVDYEVADSEPIKQL